MRPSSALAVTPESVIVLLVMLRRQPSVASHSWKEEGRQLKVVDSTLDRG